jgi:long-subunit acyl-CoA synthetase (AMP-forming)
LGLGRGDVIACYLDDQYASMLVTLASALLGVQPCPLSQVFSANYFRTGIIERVEPKVILTTPERSDEFKDEGRALLCTPPRVTQLDIDNSVTFLPRGPQTLDFGEALAELRALNRNVRRSDPLMISPTSGSTGLPKLVLRSHAGVTRYARFVGEQLPPEQGVQPRFLAIATLNHAFGLHMLTTAMLQGGAVLMTSEIDTTASLAEIRKLDPTVVPMVPRVQQSIVRQHDEFLGGDATFGPSCRYVCSAGGRPHHELLRRFSAQGIEIIEFYGSTEASLVAVTPRGSWRAGWAGRICPDVTVRVSPQGELWIKSPGVASGYLGDPELIAEMFSDDGFYRSGDLGEVSDDGFICIYGRARDVFNTSEGSNIYPQRIEQKLEQLGLVHQAMLVGDAKPYLTAVLTLREDSSIELPECVGGVVPVDHELYATIRRQIAEINCDLEKVEQVARFLVLDHSFPPEVYRTVTAGKVRRDRAAFDDRYRAQIAELYRTDTVPIQGPTFVPGSDRRLRPIKRKWEANGS